MPFSGNAFSFNAATIRTINPISGVYGLFRMDARQNAYLCLYVGESNDLNRRLSEHLNNPPADGITHFFAESVPGPQRFRREATLIAEFNPPGNTQLRR
jgi:hypothetical protein